MTRHADSRKRKVNILLQAATTVISVSRRLGFHGAVHGPLAVHVLDGDPASAPASWTVSVFIHALLSPLEACKAIAGSDAAHFIKVEESGPWLHYQYLEPDPLLQLKKCTCRIMIITSLPNYTFECAATATASPLPLAPFPFLLYELLRLWNERHRLPRDDAPKSKAKAEEKDRVFDALLRRILDKQTEVACTEEHGSFTKAGFEEMSQLIASYAQSSPERQQIIAGLQISQPASGDLPSSQSTAELPLPEQESANRASGAMNVSPNRSATLGASSVAGSMYPQSDSRVHVAEAACAAINILYRIGCSAAIFGGFACSLYGTARPPKDADILVLPLSALARASYTTEGIKNMIVTHDPIHFFSVPGRAPGATYCVLRYRPSLTTTQFIKVDILLPGTLHLPALHPSHIACISGFPVIPFALLLLQKLQAYDDHWNAQERHHFVRWKKDRDDVQALMGLHDIVGQTIRELPWGDATVFSDEFLALSVQRVAKFAGRFEWSRATWKALGFKV